MNDEAGSRGRGSVKNIFRYLDLGLRLALSVFLGVYFGHMLDRRLSSTPLFVVLGLLVGAASGLWSIYRAVFPPANRRNGD